MSLLLHLLRVSWFRRGEATKGPFERPQTPHGTQGVSNCLYASMPLEEALRSSSIGVWPKEKSTILSTAFAKTIDTTAGS